MLRPITERLLLSAGIGPGIRVLDIGCGAGDVAMVAADLVGPSGSVVGIDRNPQVLAIAGERAQGDRLIQHFSDHGLPQPHLFSETQIWGGADAFCNWMVGILRSLLPQLQRMGILLGDMLVMETLEKQLRDGILQRGAR